MNIWAVIISIEDYPNIGSGLARKLPGTDQAAGMFRAWVMQVKNVPEANIISCAGPGCAWRTKGTTRKDMIDAFNALVAAARDRADEVYVFFSGHGIGFSDDPNGPVVDILIGSEFDDPGTSGAACLRFGEVRERLRVAVGPGKHFYFVDACRNVMNRSDTDPVSGGLGAWGRSKLGNATSYVLFSTAPGDVAKVDSSFNAAVLSGLKGKGRAKTWIGGNMHVTFDNLSSYVQQMLKKNDLEPEKKGPQAANDGIVELIPTPVSNCEVEVIGAGPADQFTLDIVDVRNMPRASVKFKGPLTTVQLSPDDYLFRLTTAGGVEVTQIEPPKQPDGVDLYDDRKVRFEIGLPTQPVVPGPLIADAANITFTGIPNAEVFLQDLATGQTQRIDLQSSVLRKTLQPGQYKAKLQDGNFKLDSFRLNVSPGASINLDFAPKASQGAKLSLSRMLETHGSLIDFSETLSGVPDWNLSLWLAVLGGSRIVAAADTFSKLEAIRVDNVTDATPNRSTLYVLAGELDTDKLPVWGVGSNPNWQPMAAVPDVPGLFQVRMEFEPGALIVSYAPDKQQPTQTTTVMTHGLPNRATLITFANDERYGRQIQQFILPIWSLMDRLSDREVNYLRDPYNPPLPRIRYMSTAQRLFARQAPIEGNTPELPDRYWMDLLYGKWLNPLLALIACYELIRRGSVNEKSREMQEVLQNMRTYFSGLPDTEVIAMLLEQEYRPLNSPPLLMDGTLAVSGKDIFPLPESKLDYDGIWTTWRSAVTVAVPAPMLAR
jgi:hypothetical protein